MCNRTQLLIEFRACYERLDSARNSGDERALRHAELNFHAAAESLARLVPKLVDSPEQPAMAMHA